jgi:hypothetical protein
MDLQFSIEREEHVEGLDVVVARAFASEPHIAWERHRKRLDLLRDVIWSAVAVALIWAYSAAAWPLLLLAALWLLIDLGVRWAISRIPRPLGVTYHPHRNHGLRASFRPDAITIRGETHSQTWHPSLLRDVHERPGVYVLEFAGYEMLVVPKRAFMSSEAEADWLASLRRELPGRNARSVEAPRPTPPQGR